MRDDRTNSEDRATQPNGSWRLSFAKIDKDKDILRTSPKSNPRDL